MKNIVNYIISNIVEDGEKIKIDQEEENGFINIVINAPKESIGKIIGKEGKIIRSIRNIMKIPAIKQGKKVNITLNEIS